MKITLETGGPVNLIRGYSDAEVRIGERRVRSSCLVSADTLITDWEPQCFDELRAAHMQAVLQLAPELVLLGTGPEQQFAPAEIRALLARYGVGLEAMQLGAACRTFNVLVQEERRVAAALFLR